MCIILFFVPVLALCCNINNGENIKFSGVIYSMIQWIDVNNLKNTVKKLQRLQEKYPAKKS